MHILYVYLCDILFLIKIYVIFFFCLPSVQENEQIFHIILFAPTLSLTHILLLFYFHQTKFYRIGANKLHARRLL